MLSTLYSNEGVKITLQVPEKDLFVFTTPGRIQQIITNLLQNSKDAMVDLESKLIKITIENKIKDYVSIEVSDIGIGIPEFIQSKIFDSFYTTKSPGMGTGLGLGIVSKLVTDMKGSIEVQSTSGVGSCFTIKLPLVSEKFNAASSVLVREGDINKGGAGG